MTEKARGALRGKDDRLKGRPRATQFIHIGTYARYKSYWDAYEDAYKGLTVT